MADARRARQHLLILPGLALTLLLGCAGTPYLEAGLGYRVDRNSDWYLRGDRQWTGRSPLAHLELGVAWDSASCGYHHWSSLRDGGPFNSNPELYQDELICRKRWSMK